MVQKKDIRDNVLKKRNLISSFQKKLKSDSIFEKVSNLEEFKESTEVFLYVNFGSEVETMDFIDLLYTMNKKVYLPRVNPLQKVMDFYEVENSKQLVPGYYGILEPDISLGLKQYTDARAENTGENSDKNKGRGKVQNQIMIMPGVAFDEHRNRIGYGGGFYDKYIEDHMELFKVMVGFDLQEVEAFDAEVHDCKPDLIITETKEIR